MKFRTKKQRKEIIKLFIKDPLFWLIPSLILNVILICFIGIISLR